MGVLEKRISLPEYQESLNIKFSGKDNTKDSVETNLGLIDEIADIYLFFPLKELRKVTINQRPESLYIVNDWIAGFTHVVSDVYTVVRLDRVLDHLVLGKDLTKNIIKNKEGDIHTIYLKKYDKNCFSILVNSLSLVNVETDLDLIKAKDYDKIDLNHLNKKERFIIRKIMRKKPRTKHKDIIRASEVMRAKGLGNYISNIYQNKKNKRLVFELNIEQAVNLLAKVSVYERR